jgi:hypothetical protein
MPIPPAPPQNTPPEGGYRQQGQSYGPNHHNRGRERASGPGGFLSNLFGQGSGRRARASPRNQNENFPGNQPPAQEDIPGQPQSRPEPPPDTAERSGTTLIQDILNGIGLDDDRILILGLILILINDKADTTLIFALLYLLL